MGTSMPSLASPSTIAGTAAAAASLLTVTRTSSEPALASAATCWMVPCTSAVSVLVMDWTTTGAEDPTRTFPTKTVVDFLRSCCAINPSSIVYQLSVFDEGLRARTGRVHRSLGAQVSLHA